MPRPLPLATRSLVCGSLRAATRTRGPRTRSNELGEAMRARWQDPAAEVVGGRRMGGRWRAAALIAMLAIASPTAASLAQESDWPCPQRLVPTLEGGQMWSGPPLPAVEAATLPTDVATLAQELVDVDLPPETVAAKVQAYAASLPPEERSTGLARLFAASLEAINDQRGDMIAGIKRYTQRQQRLAERIAGETRELEALRRDASADPNQVAELQASRDWDLRVHTDRQRALRQVCEQPVRLEQRAFAVARTIQEQLP